MGKFLMAVPRSASDVFANFGLSPKKNAFIFSEIVIVMINR